MQRRSACTVFALMRLPADSARAHSRATTGRRAPPAGAESEEDPEGCARARGPSTRREWKRPSPWQERAAREGGAGEETGGAKVRDGVVAAWDARGVEEWESGWWEHAMAGTEWGDARGLSERGVEAFEDAAVWLDVGTGKEFEQDAVCRSRISSAHFTKLHLHFWVMVRRIKHLACLHVEVPAHVGRWRTADLTP